MAAAQLGDLLLCAGPWSRGFLCIDGFLVTVLSYVLLLLIIPTPHPAPSSLTEDTLAKSTGAPWPGAHGSKMQKQNRTQGAASLPRHRRASQSSPDHSPGPGGAPPLALTSAAPHHSNLLQKGVWKGVGQSSSFHSGRKVREKPRVWGT